MDVHLDTEMCSSERDTDTDKLSKQRPPPPYHDTLGWPAQAWPVRADADQSTPHLLCCWHEVGWHLDLALCPVEQFGRTQEVLSLTTCDSTQEQQQLCGGGPKNCFMNIVLTYLLLAHATNNQAAHCASNHQHHMRKAYGLVLTSNGQVEAGTQHRA
jgi:hypothetical protein